MGLSHLTVFCYSIEYSRAKTKIVKRNNYVINTTLHGRQYRQDHGISLWSEQGYCNKMVSSVSHDYCMPA